MAKQSKLFSSIHLAVTEGNLKEPFSVNDINITCNNLLAKSRSFLSKHRKGNPGGYKVYFVQDNNGKHYINNEP